MGASNVSKVFTHWHHLDHRQVRGLAYMANVALDADEPPVYFGGWEALAAALGKDPEESPETARKAATRVVTELRKAGAVVVSPAVNQARARYALALDPEHTVTPVGRGRSVSWETVPRGTLTVPPQGDTHRPISGTLTVPPQGDTGGPDRGTLTVPRRSTEEPHRGVPEENIEDYPAATSPVSPGPLGSFRKAAEDQSLDDRRNAQLAALRARYANWNAPATGTD